MASTLTLAHILLTSILQVNSFQAIVVGDSRKHTIKVRYIYQDRAMNWNLVIFGNPNLDFYPARIGIMFSSKGKAGISESYVASGIYTKVSSMPS